VSDPRSPAIKETIATTAVNSGIVIESTRVTFREKAETGQRDHSYMSSYGFRRFAVSERNYSLSVGVADFFWQLR